MKNKHYQLLLFLSALPPVCVETGKRDSNARVLKRASITRK